MSPAPASTGPSGPYFEGQLGACYLLAMLADAEPRGLPGVRIVSVATQRADEGYPLDDVIVKGQTRDGHVSCLEIQAKRSATFSPSDPRFKEVMKQVARAVPKLDFSNEYHQFATAVDRGTTRILQDYQEVLRWAREIGDADSFFVRLNRPGAGNKEMRVFVNTFSTHLQSAGCDAGNERVWQLLRRFQILVFDFSAPGSLSLVLVHELARQVLMPSDATRASALFQALTANALRIASSGGDTDRTSLIQAVTHSGFKIAERPDHQYARSVLTEATVHAMADLRGSIEGVTLFRTALVQKVQAACAAGRYVEIIGDAGVGKSGVLHTLAEHTLREGLAWVLVPGRVIRGGWTAVRSSLSIHISASEFLAELACNGGGTLFIDSLDSFTDNDERATVNDLVREACTVPGFHVIATARTHFDQEEPNWLPSEILDSLGRAPPVVVGELDESEIETLRDSTPALRALLADDHPSRQMARNLFRLSRLVESTEAFTTTLRTEIDIASLWWSTGDNAIYAQKRYCRRILAQLADASIAGRSEITTAGDPGALAALCTRGTLRELSLDRFTFTHDILRDWAMAMRIYDEPSRLNAMAIERPLPPSLARGVELLGRAALERLDDVNEWLRLLTQLDSEHAHPSWRRQILLAIVRSEDVDSLLTRATPQLLLENGELARELMRTVIAVESQRLDEIQVNNPQADVRAAAFYVPTTSACQRLIQWAMEHRNQWPSDFGQAVIDLFLHFGLVGYEVPKIGAWMCNLLCDWLVSIEMSNGARPLADGQIAQRYHSADSKIARDVRSLFLGLARHAPSLAKVYLEDILRLDTAISVRAHIVCECGETASQVAPTVFAELVMDALIVDPPELDHHGDRRLFSELDLKFLPASPTQGPFLNLLRSDAASGLSLVRRLVAHADFDNQVEQSEPGEGIRVVLNGHERIFANTSSYLWSRDGNAGYAVQCALLALEKWTQEEVGKNRVSIRTLIDSLLENRSTSAAFLAPVVGLILSDWLDTIDIAIPFVGSPELLAIDRCRRNTDIINGDATVRALENLVPEIAFSDHDSAKDQIRLLLQAERTRLGPPSEGDIYSAAFLAQHAQNMLNRDNYQEHSGKFVYRLPPDDESLFIQARTHQNNVLIAIESAIREALDDSSKSDLALAENALCYAKEKQRSPESIQGLLGAPDCAVAIASYVFVRDGAEHLILENRHWIVSVFRNVLSNSSDQATALSRQWIGYNSSAVSVLGIIELYHRVGEPTDRDELLWAASLPGSNAADGFQRGIDRLNAIDQRLIRSVLRIGMAAQLFEQTDYFGSEVERQTAIRNRDDRVAKLLVAETAWLDHLEGEPNWTEFPPTLELSSRVPYSTQGEHDNSRMHMQSNLEVDSQAAGQWLSIVGGAIVSLESEWLLTPINVYSHWTAIVNGLNAPTNAQLIPSNFEWNQAYYALMASVIHHASAIEAVGYINKVTALPDDAFVRISPILFNGIDQSYFNTLSLDLESALELRGLLTDRLLKTSYWIRQSENWEFFSDAMSHQAIGALFFSEGGSYFADTRCYLTPLGIENVSPFLDKLLYASATAQVPITSRYILNLFEVSPRLEHLSFVLDFATLWLKRSAIHTELWQSEQFGARLISWLEALHNIDRSYIMESVDFGRVTDLISRLVSEGVPEAHRFERIMNEVS